MIKTRIFTSGLLIRERRILLLKRRADDGRNPDKWDCLGGHFLSEESGEDCMIREAKEESGLEVRITKSGRVFEYTDRYGRAVGLPYLLESDSNRARPTEHSRYVWVLPEAVSRYDCVPEVGILLRRFRLA